MSTNLVYDYFDITTFCLVYRFYNYSCSFYCDIVVMKFEYIRYHRRFIDGRVIFLYFMICVPTISSGRATATSYQRYFYHCSIKWDERKIFTCCKNFDLWDIFISRFFVGFKIKSSKLNNKRTKILSKNIHTPRI